MWPQTRPVESVPTSWCSEAPSFVPEALAILKAKKQGKFIVLKACGRVRLPLLIRSHVLENALL